MGELSYEKLLVINNIRFTPREVDVLACLLKAMSTKKIASFLPIATQTVRNHIQNIMTKIGCNVRDGIIEFIEHSQNLPLLKEHYLTLLFKASFEKSLKEISKIKRDAGVFCKLICWAEISANQSFVNTIQSHLKLAGIITDIELRKNKPIFHEVMNEAQKDHSEIYILPNDLTAALQENSILKDQNNYSPNRLFLFSGHSPLLETCERERPNLFLNLESQENYFFAFFNLFNKLFTNLDVDKIVAAFKDTYKKAQIDYKSAQILLSEASSSNHPLYQKWGYVVSVCALAIFIGCVLLVFTNKSIETTTIHSDLSLPTESAFLDRSELITRINEGFKKKEGIQNVALVGIGGAGKTTLARQYGHQQKASIIWEINAETKTSLIESFDKLAYALSITDEERRRLQSLQEVQNASVREKELLQLVKKQLKLHSNWLLIYDNVEQFADIHQFFPEDPRTWGKGKIILTTRDNNIQNNKHIDRVVYIGELNLPQKLLLFDKIMNSGNIRPFTPSDNEKARAFVAQLPSFPLDISTAAYYIKATNISYAKYLEHLSQFDKDFSNLQENLLKESGDYKKTRYNIITLSVKQLMANHKDFADLLLFISLLDSQNIPRDLLNGYKGEPVVESFIYHLKKYSLITNESPLSSKDSSFSIHRSTQALTLLFFKQILNLEKNTNPIEAIVYSLQNHMDKLISREDSSTMKSVVGHYEAFLTHSHLLTALNKASIVGELGCFYVYLGNYVKAKKNLETALSSLDTYKNNDKKAQFLLHLGMLNRELGHFDRVKSLLEQSYQIYINTSPKNSLELAQNLTHLGHFYYDYGELEKGKSLLDRSLIIYQERSSENPVGVARVFRYLGMLHRRTGDYIKAENFFKQGLNIYEKNFSDNEVGHTWTFVQLGNLYKVSGKYKEAKDILEKCYKINKENKETLPKNILCFAYTLVFLGDLYIDLGEYGKAKSLYEQSLAIHKRLLGDNNLKTAWILVHLENINAKLGLPTQAKIILEKNLESHKKYFTKDHFKIAWILLALGDTYKKLGEYEKAKKALGESLAMYEKRCGKENSETAQVLESLGQVYLLQGNTEAAENLVKESLRIFQQNDHPKLYSSLESLSDVFLARSKVLHKNDPQQSLILKNKAIQSLKQSLDVIKTHFPENSPHKKRIESKLGVL